MRQATSLIENEILFKEIIDTRTQALLKHVAEQANKKGMAINAAKTGLMLVSAATSYQPRTRISLNNETVSGKDSLKVLGVTLVIDLSFQDHVENIAAKTRSKAWALSKLRRKGLSEEKLLRAYKCLVRPSLEYAAPAVLERQQIQVLKNIYGTSLSANKLRKKAGLGTLFARKEDIVTKFAKKV